MALPGYLVIVLGDGRFWLYKNDINYCFKHVRNICKFDTTNFDYTKPMKRIYIQLFFLFCSILSLPVLAQNTLRVELVPQNVDSFSVIKNNSLPFTLRLYNDSATNYVDLIDFNYTIDSAGIGAPQLYTDTNNTSGLNYPVVSNATIPANDSVNVTITINAGEPRFKTGPSVVVIWPIRANTSIAGNKVTFHVFVLDPAGIEDQAHMKLRAFVWDNNLAIQREDGIQLNRLQIYDVTGREIMNKQNPAGNTILPLETHGIYIAEITYNHTERKTFRFYY